jgi:hypothetical protein
LRLRRACVQRLTGVLPVPFEAKDAEFLLTRPEFRRFLFAAIQSSGILVQTVSATTAASRDLGHFEGRRALGFDLLMLAHAGQSEAVRNDDPDGITTLALCLTEALSCKDTHIDSIRFRDSARYDELPHTG